MRFPPSPGKRTTVLKVPSLSRRKYRLNARDNWRFHKAFRFLKKNCYKPIATADLSKASNLSRRGLQKAFKRHAGQSPGRELRRRRIEHAKYLLARFDYKLTTIAKMCGYRSQNSFWVSFRNAVGQSPGNFRNRLRPNPSRHKINPRQFSTPRSAVGVIVLSSGTTRFALTAKKI